MENGKKARLSQFINKESGNSLMVAMDHGIFLGPIEGIKKPLDTIKLLCQGKPDTFFMPIGLVKMAYKIFIENRIPFIISIDSRCKMGPEPDYIILSDSVEHALIAGASGISMHTLVGPEKTSDMLKGLAMISESCDKFGMPLLAIMYPEGFTNNQSVEHVKWAARIGAELGADLVETYYTGSVESFSEVVESCPVPVLLSGGELKKKPIDFLRVLKNVIDVGGRGCAIGRNIWQYKDPISMLKAIRRIVHEKSSPEDALKVLK
jgi:DhnA family fructose-bisphosphate aldolase class Ia